jgi:hypothetical protein
MPVAAAPGASRWRLDTGVLLLLAFPALLFGVRGAWFYNAYGMIDPWVYNGFFRSLHLYQGNLFPETYYGSRLTWVVPGYFAYKFLGPNAGHLVLHLGFYLLGMLGLYWTLKPAAGRRAALLAALAFAGYPYVVWTAGWDYPDGPGMGYFLAGMACLTAAARGYRPALMLVGAGAAGAATFYTHVVAFTALPAYLLYYPAAAAVYRQARPRREALRGALLMTLGAALLTLLLGCYNYRHGGLFWFYLPSIRFSRYIIGINNPWFDAHLQWSHATWVYAHLLGAVVCLLVLAARLRRSAFLVQPDALQVVFALNYLFGLAWFVAAEVHGRPDLQDPGHMSYIVPNLFLALGANLGRLPALSRRGYAVMTAGVSLALALPFAARPMVTVLSAVPCWVWAGSAGLALAPLVFLPQANGVRQTAPWACLGLTLLASGAVPDAWGIIPYNRLGENHGHTFRCVDAGWKYVRALAGPRCVRVWYSDAEQELTRQAGSDLAGLFMWGYIFVNRDFPDLTKESGCHPVAPGEVVVVVSGNEAARRLTVDAFAARGLEARHLGSRQFRVGEAWLPLLVFQIERASPSSAPVNVAPH